ncbi:MULTISPECIES: phosphate/phosphite/phosphonate ABC transporter substrate-binding protein [Agrobacterium]|uniref:Phosphonate-binding periplasmic protein n=1 Tax=Agrobacterium tumefaciens GW4 TaxID=1315272 RepID=I6QN00_AGRTU|nr:MULTISPECIES: phosphate/phosphite/phosphonate ABC transporter substrate-binding protein [Agrobacterium]EPR21291.1 phosphonate ABC transporter substrate-binding protein [Agrobacterium radiobacter DSM 30147]AFM38854.1 phosphonate-binding periplasmic protein [Agrobacterium tumefaciens GW4]KDR86827.1 phosphonate ABC transporter substrate-binding protein [Agrobacterium tumefaciens GW4]KVK49968.1 phosphonate ABC transporter substrate-binding protein [Agrobacterium sp. JL28]KVK50258.1 phosphonate 
MKKLAAVLALSVAFAMPAQAEFKLDARYTDADGDMVADIPTEKDKLVDPATLVFAYTPVEDPAVYADVWKGFLDHLAEKTGKKVQFFPVQENAAQIEAMRAGRLHVSGFNTGSNPIAVACAGFRPLAMMASKDGAFGYEMEIITYPGSGIEKIEDVKGKKLAFTAETSNSGFKAPSALLKSEYKLVAGTDFEPVFSGKHDNSILGVANKDYPAAAIANSVMKRMVARDVVKKDQLVSIYKSQTFPTTGYGVAHNLTPELQEKIKDAFFSYNWEGSALLKEFQTSEPPQEAFIPITFKDQWAVVRQIDDANGVSYTCK